MKFFKLAGFFSTLDCNLRTTASCNAKKLSPVIRKIACFQPLKENTFYRKKEAVSTGWGKKLRAALRPSWLAADAKLASLEPEDENYDTGIDLTEADFIADDVDADDRG